MARRALGFGAVFLAGISGQAAAATGTFTAKLWIVPLSVASNAANLPTTTPDATFTTAHLSFWMNAPLPNGGTIPQLNNTVATFLNSADKVVNLTFSGLVNGVVGSVVGPSTITTNSTATSNGTFGTCIQFTGRLALVEGEIITITHDDGVALSIDGTAQTGLTSGPGGAIAESFGVSVKTGIHDVVLGYCNYHGPGILSFSAKM